MGTADDRPYDEAALIPEDHFTGELDRLREVVRLLTIQRDSYRDQVMAVRELHTVDPEYRKRPVCAECAADDGPSWSEVPWPCPTIRAMDEA